MIKYTPHLPEKSKQTISVKKTSVDRSPPLKPALKQKSVRIADEYVQSPKSNFQTTYQQP